MKPAAFDYQRPADLPAALALLAEGGDSRILAGGQSLVPLMNFRLAQPARLIDINRIEALAYIRDDGDAVAVGALARHAQVKASPLIARHAPLVAGAYDWVAHAAVRNRGTLCGNLCHADPASEMPAVMVALGAEMVATSRDGSRRIAAEAFFRGAYETALAPGEMLTETRIPKPEAGQGWGFDEVSMRRGDFAWASVAVTLLLRGGRIAEPRISAAGVGEHAARLLHAEATLDGRAPSEGLFAEAGARAADAVDPPDTPMVDGAYRKDLARALTARAVEAAVARAA